LLTIVFLLDIGMALLLRGSKALLFNGRRTNLHLSRNLATISFETFGTPSDVLSTGKAAAAGAPGAGELKVSVKASSVLVEDVRTIMGNSLAAGKSVGVRGTAGSGTVTAVGSGVSDFSVNDSVLVVDSGLWADEAVVSKASACKLPKVSAEEAAVLPSYLTAWALLNNYVSLAAGDVVVQSNAGGSVGKAITELGKAMQLKVVAMSDADMAGGKAAPAAKLAISGQSGSHIHSMLKGLSYGGGVVVYNGVVEAPASTTEAQAPVAAMIFNDVSVNGFDLSTWVSTNPEAYQKAVGEVMSLVEAKKVSLKPSKVFPQSDFQKAIAEVSTSAAAAVLKH